MHRVGAIILAGGLSRRMGAENKLLLPVNGIPMIRRVVNTYRAAIDGEIVVVTGFEAAHIHAALLGTDVRFAHNPAFEQGQAFSVRAGLANAPDTDLILIGLGDQPRLGADDIRSLIHEHDTADGGKITIPVDGDLRGNPIIVPAAMRPLLLADQTNPGCGKFTRSHPDKAQKLPLSQVGFYHDIDTPAAFQALTQADDQGGTI